jgi:O-acetyl-ADP-ribose deacetylase (regulator of RNase III)
VAENAIPAFPGSIAHSQPRISPYAFWCGGAQGEPEFLASCYRRSLEIAAERQLTSIASPSISTGVFRYPFEPAARIAVDTVVEFIRISTSLRKVIFCCFSASDFHFYRQLLSDPRSDAAAYRFATDRPGHRQ